MKDYHVKTWFEYRGHAGGPYDANPPELWDWLFVTDSIDVPAAPATPAPK